MISSVVNNSMQPSHELSAFWSAVPFTLYMVGYIWPNMETIRTVSFSDTIFTLQLRVLAVILCILLFYCCTIGFSYLLSDCMLILTYEYMYLVLQCSSVTSPGTVFISSTKWQQSNVQLVHFKIIPVWSCCSAPFMHRTSRSLVTQELSYFIAITNQYLII